MKPKCALIGFKNVLFVSKPNKMQLLKFNKDKLKTKLISHEICISFNCLFFYKASPPNNSNTVISTF